MDRREDGCCLVYATVVVGHLEDAFPDGADEGEGRVQHDGTLRGSLNILVGVIDGDGSDAGAQSAADTAYDEGHSSQEEEQIHSGEGQPSPVCTEIFLLGQRHDIELACQPYQCHGQQYQVPVAEEFREEDASEVSFCGEFLEDACRRPAEGIGEIDGVAEVDDECDAVDDDEESFAEAVIGGRLLAIPGEQHEYEPQHVGIEDGGAVEHISSLCHGQESCR